MCLCNFPQLFLQMCLVSISKFLSIFFFNFFFFLYICQLHSLVEITQNVTGPFMTPCNLQSFVIRFGNFAIIRPNFNYFGHSHNYDATIKSFILLVRLILHLFSSINRLICPISCNSHQISYILKVFYNDIWVYFIVCTIYIKYAYVCI